MSWMLTTTYGICMSLGLYVTNKLGAIPLLIKVGGVAIKSIADMVKYIVGSLRKSTGNIVVEVDDNG